MNQEVQVLMAEFDIFNGATVGGREELPVIFSCRGVIDRQGMRGTEDEEAMQASGFPAQYPAKVATTKS